MERLAEHEWKLFLTHKAFEIIQEEFSEKDINIFLASSKGMTDDAIAEKYEIAQSSVRVYRMRLQKAMRKEVARLEIELD